MSRHSVVDRQDHLMACTACWIDWAKLTIRVGDQIEERRYYAAAGLPFPARTYKEAVMTQTTEWTPVASQLPPNGQQVEIIAPSGDQRTLIFKDNLWWLPDMSMYCYFTPTFWRPAPS